jgi:hypothetical protein
MTTITHDGRAGDTETIRRTMAEKLVFIATITWLIAGPFAGEWYANHVIIGEWSQPATGLATGMASSYFSNVVLNVLAGTLAWLFGIGVLGVLWWRARAQG